MNVMDIFGYFALTLIFFISMLRNLRVALGVAMI
jgi:hypothetical protein